jgi:hypothetical protein
MEVGHREDFDKVYKFAIIMKGMHHKDYWLSSLSKLLFRGEILSFAYAVIF